MWQTTSTRETHYFILMVEDGHPRLSVDDPHLFVMSLLGHILCHFWREWKINACVPPNREGADRPKKESAKSRQVEKKWKGRERAALLGEECREEPFL